MRFQAGIETMSVVTMLIFIFMVVGTYVFYLNTQITSYKQETTFYTSCWKLMSYTTSAAFSDKNATTYFLYNYALTPKYHSANTTSFPDYYCQLIVPVTGEVVAPTNWEYPVNGTKFTSEDGVVNITWGDYE